MTRLVILPTATRGCEEIPPPRITGFQPVAFVKAHGLKTRDTEWVANFNAQINFQ